jgi:RNA polymerase sigma factor (sigma-70 family)
VNSVTDSELLRQYAEQRSEAAFAELVKRHVDLVYSAALRMVRDTSLAEDVTQGAFIALAQNARNLAQRAVLSGWLHRTAHNLACNVVRTDVRRRAREQQAAAMTEMFSNEPDAPWEKIAPELDGALRELDETDRDALMLRYFERKSAREMAQLLDMSDAAAQKRVSRAVERLRALLARRGVTVGAGGLVLAISAHAVQAAPAGLAAGVATAAAAAGAAIQTSAAITATKTIAMTTLQKTLVAGALMAAVGTGLYQASQNVKIRRELQTVQETQTSLTVQTGQLERERDEATSRLAAATAELAQFKSGQNPNEVLRLRGAVGSLRQQLASAEAKSNSPSSGFAKMMGDPAMREYINQAMVEMIKRCYGPLMEELKLTPEQMDQFVQVVNGQFQKGVQRLALAQGKATVAGASQVEADRDGDLEKQLGSLLGESGLARFNQYSHDLPARTTVSLLDGQLGASKLSEDQRTRLFQVVNAEPFELTHGITGDLDKAFFGSPSDVEAYLAKVSDSNQRVLQEAGNFLSPDQVASLNTVLTNGITARVTQAAAFTQKH